MAQVPLDGSQVVEDLPVEQRGGVPREVWEANRANAEAPALEAKETPEVADLTKQLDLPNDYTQTEQARADALGQQKFAAEQAVGNTRDQQEAS